MLAANYFGGFGLKLSRCPRFFIATLATLPSMSLIPFAPFAVHDGPILVPLVSTLAPDELPAH